MSLVYLFFHFIVQFIPVVACVSTTFKCSMIFYFMKRPQSILSTFDRQLDCFQVLIMNNSVIKIYILGGIYIPSLFLWVCLGVLGHRFDVCLALINMGTAF